MQEVCTSTSKEFIIYKEFIAKSLLVEIVSNSRTLQSDKAKFIDSEVAVNNSEVI